MLFEFFTGQRQLTEPLVSKNHWCRMFCVILHFLTSSLCKVKDNLYMGSYLKRMSDKTVSVNGHRRQKSVVCEQHFR